jgi:hypothetical protein
MISTLILMNFVTFTLTDISTYISTDISTDISTKFTDVKVKVTDIRHQTSVKVTDISTKICQNSCNMGGKNLARFEKSVKNKNNCNKNCKNWGHWGQPCTSTAPTKGLNKKYTH